MGGMRKRVAARHFWLRLGTGNCRWPVSIRSRCDGGGNESRCRMAGCGELAARARRRGCCARLSPITETHWKSRIFTVEPEAGFPFSFWAWTDPMRGKPVAVEGDLSADGMRIAIVVARWNAVITERLLVGALDALLRSGAKRAEIGVVRVPGRGDSGRGAHCGGVAGRTQLWRSVACCAGNCALRGNL